MGAEVTNVPTYKRLLYNYNLTNTEHTTFSHGSATLGKYRGAYIQSNSFISTENAELANKNNLYI